MFLHLLVGDKVQGKEVILCEKGREGGSTKGKRVALEAFHSVDVDKLAENGSSCLTSPRANPEISFPTPRCLSPRGRDESKSRSRRARSTSLRRGNNPGTVTSVRTSNRKADGKGRTQLFDLEMPHNTGLVAYVVVDCTLVFIAITTDSITRQTSLPVLRAMRREFLYCFRAETLVSIRPTDCIYFHQILHDLLVDANRKPHELPTQTHYDVPASSNYIAPKVVTVRLNVYNILDSDTNGRFSFFGVGIHHTGVEVFGKEWSYGGILPGTQRPEDADEPGVFCVYPRSGLPSQQFKGSIELGQTEKTEEDILYILESLKKHDDWKANSYHLLDHNCNDFSAVLIRLLGGWEFPPWINRAARVTSAVLPGAVVTKVINSMTGVPDSISDIPSSRSTKVKLRKKSSYRDPYKM